jgi:hypothetical protein
MLDECKKYSEAINAKGGLLPTEPMMQGLLLIQNKMIKNLLRIIESENVNGNQIV